MAGPSQKTYPGKILQTTLRCWERKDLVLSGRGKRGGKTASGTVKGVERK